MSIADNIKHIASSATDPEEAKKELAQKFNRGSLRLMESFLKRVENGEVEIDTVRDYQGLYNMFLSVNEISLDGSNKGGGIPELSVPQKLSLEEHLKVTKKNVTDEHGNVHQESSVSLDDLSGLSVQKVNDLLEDRGKTINQDNIDKANE